MALDSPAPTATYTFFPSPPPEKEEEDVSRDSPAGDAGEPPAVPSIAASFSVVLNPQLSFGVVPRDLPFYACLLAH
jgi:hypothetical protein